VKVMARDRTGSIASPEEVERFIGDWLSSKTTVDPQASLELKAKFPLRASEVRVQRRLGKPGVYDCTIRLMPHYQLDEVAGGITLKTELRGVGG